MTKRTHHATQNFDTIKKRSKQHRKKEKRFEIANSLSLLNRSSDDSNFKFEIFAQKEGERVCDETTKNLLAKWLFQYFSAAAATIFIIFCSAFAVFEVISFLKVKKIEMFSIKCHKIND